MRDCGGEFLRVLDTTVRGRTFYATSKTDTLRISECSLFHNVDQSVPKSTLLRVLPTRFSERTSEVVQTEVARNDGHLAVL